MSEFREKPQPKYGLRKELAEQTRPFFSSLDDSAALKDLSFVCRQATIVRKHEDYDPNKTSPELVARLAIERRLFKSRYPNYDTVLYEAKIISTHRALLHYLCKLNQNDLSQITNLFGVLVRSQNRRVPKHLKIETVGDVRKLDYDDLIELNHIGEPRATFIKYILNNTDLQ